MDEIVKRLLDNHKKHNDMYITEMSLPWKTIEASLCTEVTRQLLAHLVKLYYWTPHTPTTKNDWEKDVYSFVPSISLMKRPKGKKDSYPKASKIYDTIWNAWGDRFDSIEKDLNSADQYKHLPRISVDDTCKDFCKEYLQWHSEKLSKNGLVTSAEVYSNLDSLLRKYNITK